MSLLHYLNPYLYKNRYLITYTYRLVNHIGNKTPWTMNSQWNLLQSLLSTYYVPTLDVLCVSDSSPKFKINTLSSFDYFSFFNTLETVRKTPTEIVYYTQIHIIQIF